MQNDLQITFNYQQVSQQLSLRIAQLEVEKAEQSAIAAAWQQKAQDLHQELEAKKDQAE
ncbi:MULTISPECIES: hypothetical protein [Listeria]|uniref:Uncharacterized protein n=1 Tax=Listeria grayi TaxID=1641 RepID=A0A378MGL5_LISGR|nr:MULTISPECIES: hypothetical protein [Listeria]EDN8735470.1 hypothetical protein [Listeria monocytogenes]EDO0121888.1 hypothetical protein [Listeria monocytogenes]EDO0662371.1 hypothetical protein [Listeria monocytogenes]EGF3658679.1 hypothetical protein [Listeria monocytogenes]EGF3685565.1 hypothetical protein [Listeria monocytogenes]